MISLDTSCEGWFHLSAFKVDANGEEITGSRRELIEPFRNMITDAGLNRIGTSADWLTWCQVGSGSTAPAAGDTALVSRIAGSNAVQATSTAARPTAPYYVSRTNTYRFAAGVAAGNLAEVGVGWANSGSLFSRALILDALGNPTTITILSDELLDVTYQFRQYMPTVDWTGSVTLRGVVHDVVGRACAVTETSDGNANTPAWLIEQGGTSAAAAGGAGLTAAFTGAIGPVTALSPGGVLLTSTSRTALSYSSGSLYRDLSIFFSNSDGNNAAGIGAFRVRLGIGIYQFGFSPSIMKTSSDTLSLTFRHAWSRKTL